MIPRNYAHGDIWDVRIKWTWEQGSPLHPRIVNQEEKSTKINPRITRFTGHKGSYHMCREINHVSCSIIDPQLNQAWNNGHVDCHADHYTISCFFPGFISNEKDPCEVFPHPTIFHFIHASLSDKLFITSILCFYWCIPIFYCFSLNQM